MYRETASYGVSRCASCHRKAGVRWRGFITSVANRNLRAMSFYRKEKAHNVTWFLPRVHRPSSVSSLVLSCLSLFPAARCIVPFFPLLSSRQTFIFFLLLMFLLLYPFAVLRYFRVKEKCRSFCMFFLWMPIKSCFFFTILQKIDKTLLFARVKRFSKWDFTFVLAFWKWDAGYIETCLSRAGNVLLWAKV